MAFFRARYRLLTALLAGLAVPQLAAQALSTQPPHLRELETKNFSYASESLAHAVEGRMLLPPGYSPSLEYYVVVRLEVSATGQVENTRVDGALMLHLENAQLVWKTTSVSDEEKKAVLAAVRRLPVLVPGRVAGRPTRATLTLQVRPGVAAATANAAYEAKQTARNDTVEARTLRAGTIRRQPSETLGQLLHRTLPATCADTATQVVRYAWRPNAAGPQLFFDARGHGEQAEYGAFVFVLDPLGDGAYHLQAVYLESMGDITTVIALFFADANHDGQKDLLAITQCDLREGPTKELPLGWREAHYQTTAIYYRGLDKAGRPRYEQQYREDLDELATAAKVRQALAAPPKHPAAPRRPAKPAKR